MRNFTGIKNINQFEYALYIDGYLVDTCLYNEYGKLEDWQQELEGYAWDSIASEVYREECSRYE